MLRRSLSPIEYLHQHIGDSPRNARGMFSKRSPQKLPVQLSQTHGQLVACRHLSLLSSLEAQGAKLRDDFQDVKIFTSSQTVGSALTFTVYLCLCSCWGFLIFVDDIIRDTCIKDRNVICHEASASVTASLDKQITRRRKTAVR